MSQISLQLEMYIEEEGEGVVNALNDLLVRANHVAITTFVRDQKWRSTENILASVSKFNVLEGVLVLGPDDKAEAHIVEFRYRPSISSHIWADLALPALDNVPAITSAEQHDNYQFFLSLVSFQSASLRRKEIRTAALEILVRFDPTKVVGEQAVAEAVKTIFPALSNVKAWGYASILPFRNLSPEEEWEMLRTCLLECELENTASIEHQYLFATPDGQPKVAIPPSGVREGDLTIYHLLPPRGTQAETE